MKRSEFFKSIFGAIAVTAIPVKSEAVQEVKQSEQEFSFDEMFKVHDGNDRLIIPRHDCELYKQIKELVGIERILESKYFTCYYGYHYNIIPVKEKYSLSDFMPFILAIKSYYNKDRSFSEYVDGVFFRMFKETPETMYFDTYWGDVKGQYHS